MTETGKSLGRFCYVFCGAGVDVDFESVAWRSVGRDEPTRRPRLIIMTRV